MYLDLCCYKGAHGFLNVDAHSSGISPTPGQLQTSQILIGLIQMCSATGTKGGQGKSICIQIPAEASAFTQSPGDADPKKARGGSEAVIHQRSSEPNDTLAGD